MSRNRGKTSLRCKRRSENPMAEYDRLPAELRHWLAGAVLPWRAQSVRRAFDSALARTGSRAEALKALDALQDRPVARDAQKIWGQAHPAARTLSAPVR